jgi:hypothetical protein
MQYNDGALNDRGRQLHSARSGSAGLIVPHRILRARVCQQRISIASWFFSVSHLEQYRIMVMDGTKRGMVEAGEVGFSHLTENTQLIEKLSCTICQICTIGRIHVHGVYVETRVGVLRLAKVTTPSSFARRIVAGS